MLTSHDKVMLKRKHVCRDTFIKFIEVSIIVFMFLAVTALNDRTLDNLLK